MRPILLATTIVLAMLSGCFGEEIVSVQETNSELLLQNLYSEANTSASRSHRMWTGQ